MPKRILDRKALREKIGPRSNVQLLRDEAAGDFPKRVQLSPNRVGWIEDEVDQWIDARAAERDLRSAPTPPRNLAARRRDPRKLATGAAA